jgi:hypothetical protein
LKTGPDLIYISNGVWKPDHLTMGQFLMIWIPDLLSTYSDVHCIIQDMTYNTWLVSGSESWNSPFSDPFCIKPSNRLFNVYLNLTITVNGLIFLDKFNLSFPMVKVPKYIPDNTVPILNGRHFNIQNPDYFVRVSNGFGCHFEFNHSKTRSCTFGTLSHDLNSGLVLFSEVHSM